VTLAKKRWLLDFAYPAIGERPVATQADGFSAKELDQEYEAMVGLNVKSSKDEIKSKNPAALGLDHHRARGACVLRKVKARGRYETARRVRSTCGSVSVCHRYRRAERDPSIDLRVR
jgi:hypothetical protein